jgi:predicted nucleotidyltransferase component of viral defense system
MKITKDAIGYIAEKTKVRDTTLVEKDILLHILLKEIASEEQFRTNYAFKGGTCLIKCYIGYYRFSEDLDFTYTRQDEFSGKSEKQIRKQLSAEIDRVSKMLMDVSTRLGLEFRNDKKDKKYMEFGAGNKFTTFKIWYEPQGLNMKRFIKIQINYVEKIIYPLRVLEAKNNLEIIDAQEFRYLYPKVADNILTNPKIQVYDIREILAEKVRAILTRRGTKARDYIDVHMIQKDTGSTPQELHAEIVEKTRFILKYEKYRENLLKKSENPPTFKMGTEEKLIIKPLSEEFEKNTIELMKYVEKLADEICPKNPPLSVKRQGERIHTT